MDWKRGKIDKIEYPMGGAGNQWTTIDGQRFATWFNWDTFSAKEGIDVEYRTYQRELWSSHPKIAHAHLRNVAPMTPAIETVETGQYKVSPWFAFCSAVKSEPAKLNRAEMIVADSFADRKALKDFDRNGLIQDKMRAHSAYMRAMQELWVLFDQEPTDDSGGFMLIGPDPEALAIECIAHLGLELI